MPHVQITHEIWQVYGFDGELLAEYPQYGASVAVAQPQKEYGYRNGQMLITAAASGGAAEVNWVVTDHLGTPRIIADRTGSTVGISRHDYLPFGEELPSELRNGIAGYTSADSVRQQFTGKERDDETGLDYFGARYFSSMQGRFTSTDPINTVIAEIDPQQINLYAYARNNPLKYVDSTGMKFDTASLNDEQKKVWEQMVALANAKDEKGNYVNPELHATYQRLDEDSRTFVIENHAFGDKRGLIGEFNITRSSGGDFTEATIQIDFNKVKNLEGPQNIDSKVPGFVKYQGLFGMGDAAVRRLAETFGHEGGHAVYALDHLAEGIKIQQLKEDRDAAMAARPPKSKWPYPPDIMQKFDAFDKAVEPSELFAQQTESKINRELVPKPKEKKKK